MTLTSRLEKSLRRYALGTGGGQPRMELEERLIREPETFEMLEVVEQQLTEEYLEGTLSRGEREGFEGRLRISPDHRRQLEFVRLLRAAAGRAAVPEIPGPWATRIDRIRDVFGRGFTPSGWVVVAAALLVAVGLWSAAAQHALRQQVDELEARQRQEEQRRSRLVAQVGELTSLTHALQTELARTTTRRPEGPAAELNRALRPTPATPSLPVFVIASSLLRGGGTLMRIAVPAATPLARFRLAAPGPRYASYRVVLFDGNADERCAFSGLQPTSNAGSQFIDVVFPSELLAPGDYQIKVSGTTASGELEVLATYTIRVTRS